MSRVSTLVVSALIIITTLTAYAEKPQKPVSTIHITFTAPESFDQLWADSHLVAHVRIMRSHPEVKAGPKHVKHVFTAHRAQVLELYKAQVPSDCITSTTAALQCVPRVGDEFVVYQHAGEVETAAEVIRIADETPLVAGDHFLFLIWHAPLNAFVSRYGSHGTFAVRDDVVFITNKGGRREHDGKAASAFADDLRRRKEKEKSR